MSKQLLAIPGGRAGWELADEHGYIVATDFYTQKSAMAWASGRAHFKASDPRNLPDLPGLRTVTYRDVQSYHNKPKGLRRG